MSNVTRILGAIEQGDSSAAEQLLPLVYDELRKLAAAKLDREKPGQTLQATALVHEAYLRLVDTPSDQLLALDEALCKLALEDPQKEKLVKLRYFAGMSVDEAAAALGISRATVDHYWTYAKTRLYCELEDAKISEKRADW
jgi:DNA-directed RNA polymerase specialized sigma24 family protein